MLKGAFIFFIAVVAFVLTQTFLNSLLDFAFGINVPEVIVWVVSFCVAGLMVSKTN